MLMGRTDMLPDFTSSSKNLLLADIVAELNENAEDNISENILYMASFEELKRNNVQYDTIIWISLSLLLVLAWGVGVIMLLYLPFKRYVLQKDISSRKLYVTPNEIVYKVSRPSYIPFFGFTTFERHIPLHLVIDIIIEQGCLQSRYGIHTFRIESIAHGKAAPVDELLVQGVSDPRLLRKIIISEASKIIQDVGRSLNPVTNEEEYMARMASLTDGPASFKSPKSIKMPGSPRVASVERRTIPGDLLLHKLDEVNKSIKRIESLMEKSQASTVRAESRSIPPFPSLD